MTPQPTDLVVRTALTAFLRDVAPAAEIVRGQINRVPTPAAANFVVYWPTARPRLSTNVESWDTAADAPTAYDYTANTEAVYQLDVHGPDSADAAQVIATLFRSPHAVTLLGPDVAPLFADDPQQIPFENAEKQIEFRWVVIVHMQVNPTVSTAAQFADRLAIDIHAPVDSGALA